jgi:hypothetical protein
VSRPPRSSRSGEIHQFASNGRSDGSLGYGIVHTALLSSVTGDPVGRHTTMGDGSGSELLPSTAAAGGGCIDVFEESG